MRNYGDLFRDYVFPGILLYLYIVMPDDRAGELDLLKRELSLGPLLVDDANNFHARRLDRNASSESVGVADPGLRPAGHGGLAAVVAPGTQGIRLQKRSTADHAKSIMQILRRYLIARRCGVTGGRSCASGIHHLSGPGCRRTRRLAD